MHRHFFEGFADIYKNIAAFGMSNEARNHEEPLILGVQYADFMHARASTELL
jgi:hypothetical protein